MIDQGIENQCPCCWRKNGHPYATFGECNSSSQNRRYRCEDCGSTWNALRHDRIGFAARQSIINGDPRNTWSTPTNQTLIHISSDKDGRPAEWITVSFFKNGQTMVEDNIEDGGDTELRAVINGITCLLSNVVQAEQWLEPEGSLAQAVRRSVEKAMERYE